MAHAGSASLTAVSAPAPAASRASTDHRVPGVTASSSSPLASSFIDDTGAAASGGSSSSSVTLRYDAVQRQAAVQRASLSAVRAQLDATLARSQASRSSGATSPAPGGGGGGGSSTASVASSSVLASAAAWPGSASVSSDAQVQQVSPSSGTGAPLSPSTRLHPRRRSPHGSGIAGSTTPHAAATSLSSSAILSPASIRMLSTAPRSTAVIGVSGVDAPPSTPDLRAEATAHNGGAAGSNRRHMRGLRGRGKRSLSPVGTAAAASSRTTSPPAGNYTTATATATAASPASALVKRDPHRSTVATSHFATLPTSSHHVYDLGSTATRHELARERGERLSLEQQVQ